MSDIWIRDDHPIRVPFQTDGLSFYRGGRGLSGVPAEAFLRLVAVAGDRREIIPDFAGLEGRVSIRTPEEALAFVRLFTSPDTHYLFPGNPYVEPAASEFPRERAAVLAPATSRADGDAFVVERNVVDREGRLSRITERVGANGSYALVRAVTIDEQSPVGYPVYQ